MKIFSNLTKIAIVVAATWSASSYASYQDLMQAIAEVKISSSSWTKAQESVKIDGLSARATTFTRTLKEMDSFSDIYQFNLSVVENSIRDGLPGYGLRMMWTVPLNGSYKAKLESLDLVFKKAAEKAGLTSYEPFTKSFGADLKVANGQQFIRFLKEIDTLIKKYEVEGERFLKSLQASGSPKANLEF